MVDSIKAVRPHFPSSPFLNLTITNTPFLTSQVESAWGDVAKELGLDPEEVIAATHGRRAIDNLKDLKPSLRRLSNAEMEPHVEEVS